MSFEEVTPPEVPSGMAATVETIWDNGGDVWEWNNASVYKLTRGALLKSTDWEDWQQSELTQLDQ